MAGPVIMVFRPARLGLLAAAAALTLTACGSSTDGGPGNGVTPPASGGNAVLGPHTTPKQLAQLVTSGFATLSGVHISLRISAAGSTITGTGDELLENGKLFSLQLTETLPGKAGTITVVAEDGVGEFAKVPASLNHTGKPWVLVSPSSHTALGRQLAKSLGDTLGVAPVENAKLYAKAATKVSYRGTSTISGVKVTHMHVLVDLRKAASSASDISALRDAGVSSIPVDLYLSSDNRPVETDATLKVDGQTITERTKDSDYNEQVMIEPPPKTLVAL